MPSTSLDPYPSPEERDRGFVASVEQAGGTVEEYGQSMEGRPLLAGKLPATRPDAPRILCSANIHGLEFIAGQVALGLLRTANTLDRLRARAEVWFVACINPDGYARTWAAGGDAPRLSDLRANANGVDLNRNYPRPGGAAASRWPGAGSDKPGAATYRGPAPLSEPETAALDRLMTTQRFHASANLHSFMGTVIPARVRRPEWFSHYRHLCKAFAAGQLQRRYHRLSSRLFDVFTGEQEDHQHHVHDCWAVCVESFPVSASFRQHLRAPTRFWRFNPRDPKPWVANDVAGLAAYFHAALDRPRPSEVLAKGALPQATGT